MKNKYIKGLPSLLFMQSVDYTMSTDSKNYMVSLPRKGFYKDIAPEFFTEEDGEFNIFDEVSGTLYLPSITKVLLATSRYPELSSNQVAVPISIKFNIDTVDIVYNVLDMVNLVIGSEDDELPSM